MRPAEFVAQTFPVASSSAAFRGEDDDGWWTWRHPDTFEGMIYTPGMAVPRVSHFVSDRNRGDVLRTFHCAREAAPKTRPKDREEWTREERRSVAAFAKQRGNLVRLQAHLLTSKTTIQGWIHKGTRPPVGTLERIRQVMG